MMLSSSEKFKAFIGGWSGGFVVFVMREWLHHVQHVMYCMLSVYKRLHGAYSALGRTKRWSRVVLSKWSSDRCTLKRAWTQTDLHNFGLQVIKYALLELPRP